MWRGAALSTSKLETFQGMALGRALRSKGTDKFPQGAQGSAGFGWREQAPDGVAEQAGTGTGAGLAGVRVCRDKKENLVGTRLWKPLLTLRKSPLQASFLTLACRCLGPTPAQSNESL